MTVRTTVAFDPATAARLERLAKRWGISKSETLRRALEAAERSQARETDFAEEAIARMTPLEAFEWLQKNPILPPGTGEKWRQELREQRQIDTQIEEEREVKRRSSKPGPADQVL